MTTPHEPFPSPFEQYTSRVLPDWIDANVGCE